jgi:nitric oxide reductase subunit C
MTLFRARLIFIGLTVIASLFFLALTWDTLIQFPVKTHEEKLTVQAVSGKWVWQKYNCNNCHTILGIGGYYAPDITKVMTYRDTDWMSRFIKNPDEVWPAERIMPSLHLTDQEISDVISFLTWVGGIDTNGWPPKPVVLSGAASPDPGEAVFKSQGCKACHKIGSVGGTVGPDLTHVGSRRDNTWIKIQIKYPKAHNPNSIMPSFGKLHQKDIEELSDYLSGMK